MNWEDLLVSVEKPSRYLGTEVNAVHKDGQVEVRFVLAFPDTYEVGMSHLGIQILYALLNRLPGVAAERSFAPWPDMEALLRRHNVPLASLESRRPLAAFDVVGFSLQYELSYTNVLNMLELGGIPLLRKDRTEASPLIIAGGPCAFNPAPMADFIDAFVIGEGEEIIVEIAAKVGEAKKKGWGRTETLASLAECEGIYVPAFQEEGKRIRKRVVADLNAQCSLLLPLVPLMKTVHDRIVLEIARGCTRGCRFCQAGMVWRPVRERTQEILEGMAETMLCATGYDEISLLSLSSGDYSRIEPLLATLMERYYERRVALGLPSLRVETLTRSLIENIRRVRKTSFTLAPEAGTQRLRNIINKGNSSAELLQTIGEVFGAGWNSVKLYFMLGLPTESRDDLEGIAELAYQALKEGKQRGQVTISLSTFVPKAHTPFQWQRQIDLQEVSEKQAFLKGRIRHRNLSLKWHDGRMSVLEGILARGDSRTGLLIAEAFRLGCRFDGWTDMLHYDLWEEAMARTGLRPELYLGPRERTGALPWEMIDCGVTTSFLREEEEKALTGALTADCRLGDCHDCGACDQKTVMIVNDAPSPARADAARPEERGLSPLAKDEPTGPGNGVSFRITFAKQGAARFLSHLELAEALIRAIKRSGLSFVYSQGYHPHPRISFAVATSVGMESRGEYADIQVAPMGKDQADLQKEINAFLPTGLEILAIEKLTGQEASLAEGIKGFSYTLSLPEMALSDLPGLREKLQDFLTADTFFITRERKGKVTTKDIKPLVTSLSLDEENRQVLLSLRIGNEGTARPMEVLTEVLGIDGETAKRTRIVKTKTTWKTGDEA